MSRFVLAKFASRSHASLSFAPFENIEFHEILVSLTVPLTAPACGGSDRLRRTFADRGDRYVDNPRKLGNELDPDSIDPNDELLGQTDDVEHVEEDSEPLAGTFAY
jgi:hypothetical protein